MLIQNEAKNLITQLRENNGSEPILLARNRVRDIVCRVKHKEDKNILNTSVLMRGFKYHVEMTFSSLFDLESMTVSEWTVDKKCQTKRAVGVGLGVSTLEDIRKMIETLSSFASGNKRNKIHEKGKNRLGFYPIEYSV